MPDTPHEGHRAEGPMSAIKASRAGDATIIAVSGELDLASADQLDEAIRDAEKGATGWIVVDLEDLSFMDSTVLAVLLNARKRARDNGSRLRFVRSRHDQVARLLSVTDTTKMFS
jgi:anti-sigma B factor antagonist